MRFSSELVVLLLHQLNDVAVLDHWWHQVTRQINNCRQDSQQEGKTRAPSVSAGCDASLILHPAQLALEQAHDIGTQTIVMRECAPINFFSDKADF